MDPTFLTILRGLDYDTLTMAQASEVMGALREAVEKGEAWYRKFSAGFVHGTNNIPVSAPTIIHPSAISRKSLSGTRETDSATKPPVSPKRGRGRPRKVVPEVVSPTRQVRGGGSSDRDHSAPGAPPVDDHPPIGVLAGSYVSTTGPDPNRSYSLPPTHPRAAGVAPATTGDADFAAAEAGKVRFQ